MAAALLHLGFHKTGTSAAQHFLTKNRVRLAPHLQIVLLDALKPADKTARRYSKARDAASLIEFAAAFAECIGNARLDPARALLLSCEGLAGDIPGRAGVTDYSALADLTPIIVEVMQKNGFAEPTLHFTLRDPHDWLYSAYLHNIHGTKLDMDFANYDRMFGTSSDLQAIVDQVRTACPDAKVTTSHLEHAQIARFGPADALLAAFGLPDNVLNQLTPPRRVNPSLPNHLIEPIRKLNRGPLRGEALKAAKARLIAEAPDPDGAS